MEQLETRIIFREVQSLRNNFYLVSILYPALLTWYIGIHSFILGKPAGVVNVSSTCLFVLWIIFGLFLPLVFYCTKYVTEVRDDGIYTRLAPLNRSFKKIPLYIVDECKIKVSDPLVEKESDIPESPRKVSPVVILKLISGERMLIRSKKPEELCNAIELATAQY